MLVALAVVQALVTRARPAEAPPWPRFLPPPADLAPEIVSSVERVWGDRTLTRTVEGDPAPVPLDLYLALVDAPDVTAAAARHLGLARYEVHVIAPGWYRADDHVGARGLYRVLVREDGRRVILSWGSHSGWVLGTVRGTALSVMDFEALGHRTAPRLTAYVRIDNTVAARLARLLLAAFGGVVDRKLTEGFGVTAKVGEWALEHPAEFCEWMARAPLPPGRRAALGGASPCATRPGVARGASAEAGAGASPEAGAGASPASRGGPVRQSGPVRR
jgi:hypothetical protein